METRNIAGEPAQEVAESDDEDIAISPSIGN